MQSLRLQAIINIIPDGVGVLDIGTDHAQIPIYLAKHTHCQPIIASEKNIGPFNTAAKWIRQFGLEKIIDLRLGSGLSILNPNEVSYTIIAGMGFKTIIEILHEEDELARSMDCLILQPMQGAEHLRSWLYNHSYQIIDEILVKEDNHLFQIILARTGKTEKVDNIFYEVGPILYDKNDPLVREHLERLILQYENILSKINLTERTEKTRTKIKQSTEKINRLKEVLEQWQKKFNE